MIVIMPMTRMFKKTTAACMALLAMGTAAQAQVPGSALNHMLQKPRVTKYYKDKHFMDHLFVDAGGGINAMNLRDPEIAGQGELHIGDWLTPEHGLRLSLNGGLYRTYGVKSKFAGIGLDYLLNITALSQRGTSYTPRHFELYGLAGVDYTYSRHEGESRRGLGVHVGVRGQAALSPYTYLYIEPRLGISSDQVSQVESWHGYRPVASASVGLGYRLPEAGIRRRPTGEPTGWADGLFVSLMGGPAALLNSQPQTWGDQAGARFMGSIGKWMGHTNGVRLSVLGTYLNQPWGHRVKAVGGQVDYLVNLHNAFGGYDPDRWFWLNGVVGASYSYSSTYPDYRHGVPGVGAGLQANVRLSRDIDLVIEPRVDAYGQHYVPLANSISQHDVVGSVLAGLVYTYHDRRAQRGPADPFERRPWYGHTFVEMGLGANVPVIFPAARHTFTYLRPSAYMAVGKWFTPVHGARLWGLLAQTQFERNDKNRYKHAEMGADYLFNFTNAFYGYRADRFFTFSGALGANLSRRSERTALFLGLDASLRGSMRLSRMVSLFIEPRLQGYNDDYLPTQLSSTGIDLIASVNAGLQFNLNYLERTNGRGLGDDGEDYRSFISVGGGLTNHVNMLRTGRAYSPVGRIGYTHWYSPTTAWRANLQGFFQRSVGRSRHAQASLSADWLTDLTALNYGYDPDRTLSVSAFGGVGLGADIGDGRTTFAPDIHAGGQLGIRLSDAVRLNLEPQLSYQLSSRWTSQTERVMPQFLVGLDYSLQRHHGAKHNASAPAKRHVVMAGVGTGVYSASFSEVSKRSEKFGILEQVGYGQWLSHANGAYARLSNITLKRRGSGNQNITSLQAGYMMNVKSAITGEATEDQTFQLTALAGASLNMASRPGHGTHIAPGLQASLQAGVRVSPQVEVYVEPAVSLLGKNVEQRHRSYPGEGQLGVSVGTKFNF